MIDVNTAEPVCEECGYLMRGLGRDRPCPECGHIRRNSDTGTKCDAGWMRWVCIGLWLLLGLTVYGVESVLVQPFEEGLGGVLPALNYPGPKVWAVPLAQRPLGKYVETPGIVGTRTALLTVLAVWLITTRRPDRDDRQVLHRVGGKIGVDAFQRHAFDECTHFIERARPPPVIEISR